MIGLGIFFVVDLDNQNVLVEDGGGRTIQDGWVGYSTQASPPRWTLKASGEHRSPRSDAS